MTEQELTIGGTEVIKGGIIHYSTPKLYELCIFKHSRLGTVQLHNSIIYIKRRSLNKHYNSFQFIDIHNNFIIAKQNKISTNIGVIKDLFYENDLYENKRNKFIRNFRIYSGSIIISLKTGTYKIYIKELNNEH